MPGISDSSTIDVIAQDSAGEFIVVMVEDRPWDSDPAQESQLRAKFDVYTEFVHRGGLVRECPEAEGEPVWVQLDCVDEPTDAIAAVVEEAADRLDGLGIGFALNVRS
jgi:hypothetical protein